MMRKKSLVFLVILSFIALSSFYSSQEKFKTYIPASEQRTGNSADGYDYLVNGDYVNSGIPYEIFKLFGPRDSSNILNRTGKAATLPPQFNYMTNDQGVELVSPNCLTCHSDYINGEFVIGLGNSSFDYRYNMQMAGGLMAGLIVNKYGSDSKEYSAFQAFKNSTQALAGQIKTEVRGVNPADKLTSVLIAHRNPVTLEWSDSLLLDIPGKTIPTDVPPWWLLKRKNAMFYTGIGRGDFSRFLMASSILTLRDSAEARKIDERFPDVLSWINTLEAPEYPDPIDQKLALKGEGIFNKNCSGCHGSYGEDPTYPNLLIGLEKIGTDPALSEAYTDSLYRNFINWYNQSWFAGGDHPGRLVIESGYVAPPLDGIWASAPYMHNGSVPTVAHMLESSTRPRYWQRSFDSADYDAEQLGWTYKEVDSAENCNCYNTDLEAYGNEGHRFGDKFSREERMAVIEYLKTL